MKNFSPVLGLLILTLALQGLPLKLSGQNIDTAYAVADSVCSSDSFLLIARFSSPVAVEAAWDGPGISLPLIWQDTADVDTFKWAFTTTTTNVYQFTLQLRDPVSQNLYMSKQVLVFIGARPDGEFAVDSVCVGDITSFTNSSTAYGSETMTYTWDFGDLSGTSTQENPTYTFGTSGNYSAQLIVTSEYGCTDTVVNTAYVFPYPVAAFNAPDGCEGQDITFSRDTTGLNLLGWRWKFGDGSFHLGDTSVAYRYATADTFEVTLIDTNILGCVDSATQTLIVHHKPVSAVSFPSDIVCASNSTTFTRTSTSVDPILTWWWRFTSRTPREGGNTRNQTYTGVGLKTVVLIDTTIYGCSDTVTDTFYVVALPVADFSWDTVCAQHPTTFTHTGTSDSALAGWTWLFPDGDTLHGGASVQHTFDTAGLFKVVLVDTTINGCIDSSVQYVDVYPQPIPLIYTDTVCFGDSSSLSRIPFHLPVPLKNGFVLSGWSWRVEDTVYHDTYRFKHRFSAPGKFAVTLIDTVDITGCVDSITDTIVVWRLPEPALTHDTVCLGDSTTLTHTSLYIGSSKFMNDSLIRGWTWLVADSVYHNINPVRHLFTAPGEYSVTLIDTTIYGCVDSVTDTLMVWPLPAPSFEWDTACLTHPVTMERNDTAGLMLSGWTWVLDDTIAYPGQVVLTHVFGNAGIHSIKLVDTTVNGCTNSYSALTEVYDLPAPAFTHDSVCFGDSTTLRTQSVFGLKAAITAGYTWFIEDSVYHRSTLDDRELRHLFSSPGLHRVTLVDTSEYGCIDSIADTIFVFPWPAPGFTADTACFMDPTTILHLDTAAAAIANWRWVLDDTLVFLNVDPLIWTFEQSGPHTLTLVDTNIWGCVDSISGTVLVHPRPVVSIIAPVPDTFCVNDAGISLTVGIPSGGTYSGHGVNSFLGAFFPGLAGAGDHMITYTFADPATGCPSTDSVSVHVDDLPEVTLAALPPVCEDHGSLTLSGGQPAGGTYSGDFVASGVFDTDAAGPGSYRILYHYIDPGTGCANVDSTYLIVHALPVVTFTAIPDVCADHGLLTLAGGAPSNGTYTGPFVSSGTFDVDAAGVGTHDVLYIYQDTSTHCVDSALQTITVHPNPLVTIIRDDTICLGDTVLLTGTGATAYAWSDGSALPATAVSPATSAWFSVTGTDGNGCTGTDQAFILVYSLPALSVSNDTSICEGECAILTAYGAGDFSWSDGTAAASAQVCPVTTKSYIVTLTDTNGCSSTRDVEVTVYPLPPSPVSNGDKEVCFGYPNPVLEVSGNNVIWYSDPAGTQQVAVGNTYHPLQVLPGTYPYWASSTSPQGCEGPLTQVTLIIHALPAPPIGGPDRGVCLGLQNPLLSATGNAIRWYADPVLGTLLANGSTYRPAVSSTGTYKFYVTQTDPVTGCQSLPDSIILSIFELPLVNAGPDLSYIIGGDSMLTGSVVGTFPLTLAWTPVHHLGSPATAHTSVNTPVSEVYTLRVTDGNGCINTDHASVNVLPDGNSLAGRVYYDNKILRPLPYSNVIRTGLTVKDSDTAQVDAFGYYSFKQIPAGSSSFTARTGNLWGWGGVNTTDALLVARHFVKLDTLKGLSLDAADVNQDQTENTTDAVLIARRFAGLVSSFAAGDWTFMDSTFTFDSADFHVFNIGALCMGDVNRSWSPLKDLSVAALDYQGISLPDDAGAYVFELSVDRALTLGAASVVLRLEEGVSLMDVVPAHDLSRNFVVGSSADELRISWFDTDPVNLVPGQSLLSIRLAAEGLLTPTPFLMGEGTILADAQGLEMPDVRFSLPYAGYAENSFMLGQNYPNPATGVSIIPFTLGQKSHIRLEIYDMLGNLVRIVLDDEYEQGRQEVQLNAADLSPGIYVYRLFAITDEGIYTQARSMLITR